MARGRPAADPGGRGNIRRGTGPESRMCGGRALAAPRVGSADSRPMSRPPIRFFFDYVDPDSFLFERQLASCEGELDVGVERVPLELRPPPAPLVDPHAGAWRLAWERARERARAAG